MQNETTVLALRALQQKVDLIYQATMPARAEIDVLRNQLKAATEEIAALRNRHVGGPYSSPIDDCERYIGIHKEMWSDAAKEGNDFGIDWHAKRCAQYKRAVAVLRAAQEVTA